MMETVKMQWRPVLENPGLDGRYLMWFPRPFGKVFRIVYFETLNPGTVHQYHRWLEVPELEDVVPLGSHWCNVIGPTTQD